jgi:hypothetical protein
LSPRRGHGRWSPRRHDLTPPETAGCRPAHTTRHLVEAQKLLHIRFQNAQRATQANGGKFPITDVAIHRDLVHLQILGDLHRRHDLARRWRRSLHWTRPPFPMCRGICLCRSMLMGCLRGVRGERTRPLLGRRHRRLTPVHSKMRQRARTFERMFAASRRCRFSFSSHWPQSVRAARSLALPGSAGGVI